MEQHIKFRQALEENQKRIYSICCYYFGPGDDARDAFQEVLIKIWLNIKNFRGDSQLKTWVTSITINVCLTFISKAKKKNNLFTNFSQLEYFDSICEHKPDSGLDEEKLNFFKEFTTGLPHADRTLVALYLEEISYKEISEITGLSEANARTRIHRIKLLIKKAWEDKYGTR
ncbi:MAG: RNA polymerase sigma factor [Chitinophagaceae bacterium]|nr:RNA polymerase sigma factor [Chitinophagaceae bacterium]